MFYFRTQLFYQRNKNYSIFKIMLENHQMTTFDPVSISFYDTYSISHYDIQWSFKKTSALI